MKVFLIALTVVVATIVVLFLVAIQPKSSTVTLQAAAGNNVIQMFDGVGAHPKVVRNLLSGDTCDYVSGPIAINEAGVKMNFYTLKCAGRTGFVNAKWVIR